MPNDGDIKRWRANRKPPADWETCPSGSGTPSTTVTSETTWGITPAAGSSETYSRGDHTHGSPAQPQGGGTPSDTVVTETAFGQNSTAGDASTYSRGNHTHGTPADPVPAHVSASDPHTQYQKESEKGAAGGYASLNNSSKVTETALNADVCPWGGVSGKPSTYPPDTHTHLGGDVTTAVANATNAASVEWTGVQNKPSTYPPSSHSHAEGDVTGLVSDLAAKETPSGAQGKVDTHAAVTSAVHGVGQSTVASAADIATHAALTTGTHGVGASTVDSVSLRDTAISTHSGLATGVHGAGGSTLATAATLATHAALTASVHNFDASGNAPAQTHDNTRHTSAFLLASEKAAASGVASLNSSSKVVQDCANAQTPAAHALGGSAHSADTIANLQTKVSDATLETTTGSAAKVTTHDGLATAHAAATNLEKTASKGAASGYCGLDGTSKVAIANLPTGATSTTVAIGNDARLLAAVDAPARTFRAWANGVTSNFLAISGTAYFVYMGRTTVALTPKYIESYLNVIAAGTVVTEAGIFSSPSAPNKASQSLTKLAVTATWDTLTSGLGVKRSAALSTSVPAGTHLWAGVRFAFGTTQPTFSGLLYDLRQGLILITASASAFSTTGPWTGDLVTAQTAAAMVTCCPDISVTLD